MWNLTRLGNQISVQMKPDADGYMGRECPEKGCLGYFKVTPGTGLKGKDLPCTCPYCGYTASHKRFWTPEQLDYAKSVAFNQISGAVLADLRELEFAHRPIGPFGIGISMEVEGRAHPIRYYRERRLETELICERCTLRDAIYGVFGYCPDCRTHNSLQILYKNLELYEKLLNLDQQGDAVLTENLTGNALEDAVAAFDGFGRETCRVRASSATDPAKATSLSFQNIEKAEKRVFELFGVDLSAPVSQDDWELTCRCFQKRHLFAHKMGVVDEAYRQSTNDRTAVGRKVHIQRDEVLRLIGLLRSIGTHLSDHLLPP